MSTGRGRRDLFVLVADRSMELTVRRLLGRPQALGIRTVSFDVASHPQRDPGCFQSAPSLLRQFLPLFSFALVVFDRQGCGQERNLNRTAIEADVEDRLARNGWEDRSAAVVLDPELEAWVWSDSPRVDSVLGWTGRLPDLRTWLAQNESVDSQTGKPADPKGAMERAIRAAGTPPSSKLFEALASQVSLRRCKDPAFAKFRDTLQRWFPPGD